MREVLEAKFPALVVAGNYRHLRHLMSKAIALLHERHTKFAVYQNRSAISLSDTEYIKFASIDFAKVTYKGVRWGSIFVEKSDIYEWWRMLEFANEAQSSGFTIQTFEEPI